MSKITVADIASLTSGPDTELTFSTGASGSHATRVNITSTGNVSMPTSNSSIAVGQSTFTGGNIRVDLHSSGSGVGSQVAFANDHNTDKFFVGIEGNTTGNAMIYQQKDADVNFYANNSLKMTLKNNGRLGIGTSSPDSPFEVSDGVENYRIDFGTNEIYLMARNASAYIEAEYIAESHEFRGYGNDSGNLAMKIDSSANILFGSATTSAPSFSFNPDSGGGKMVSIKNSTNSRTHYEFHNPNGTIGSITTSSSSTAFNTSSDYRLKENVVTDWDATSRLKQLKPSRFNFKDNKDLTVDGFLAHEVSSIVPEAVTGTKDETEKISNVVLNADGTVLTHSVSKEKWEADKLPTTDADGNEKEPLYSSDTTWVESKIIPKYQGIDQSKLVPLLVKTIQELEARVADLESK